MKARAVDPDNLPAPKDERWKYTNLARAVPAGLAREKAPADILIRKDRGKTDGRAEDLLFAGQDKTLHAPRLRIVLEDGAQASVIERHEGAGTYWRTMAVDIELGANAHLRHYRIFDDPDTAVCTVSTSILQKRDSSYQGFFIAQGGGLVRNEIHAVLEETGAQCDLDGITLLKGRQHGDTTILIEHKAPHGRSSQFFRTVLAGESRGVFQGKVHVHKPAQKTDGYQLSNALLLSEKAEMDTKPELEIYADDVKCSHGATAGQLDAEPLFYLRARGLTEAQARRLLVQAFVDEVSDKIPEETLRALIQDKTHAWLEDVL